MRDSDSTSGDDDFGRATACFGGGAVATNIKDGDDGTTVRIDCTLRFWFSLLLLVGCSCDDREVSEYWIHASLVIGATEDLKLSPCFLSKSDKRNFALLSHSVSRREHRDRTYMYVPCVARCIPQKSSTPVKIPKEFTHVFTRKTVHVCIFL